MLSPTQGDSQLVGSSEGEVSCSGTPQHSEQLGGAEYRTSYLQVTSQPAQPPELLHVLSIYFTRGNRSSEHLRKIEQEDRVVFFSKHINWLPSQRDVHCIQDSLLTR